jgi:predicted nucleic-acid-binding Zn-ribbon protein
MSRQQQQEKKLVQETGTEFNKIKDVEKYETCPESKYTARVGR